MRFLDLVEMVRRYFSTTSSLGPIIDRRSRASVGATTKRTVTDATRASAFRPRPEPHDFDTTILYMGIVIGLGFALLIVYGLIVLYRTVIILKKKRRAHRHRRRHHHHGHSRRDEPRRPRSRETRTDPVPRRVERLPGGLVPAEPEIAMPPVPPPVAAVRPDGRRCTNALCPIHARGRSAIPPLLPPNQVARVDSLPQRQLVPGTPIRAGLVAPQQPAPLIVVQPDGNGDRGAAGDNHHHDLDEMTASALAAPVASFIRRMGSINLVHDDQPGTEAEPRNRRTILYMISAQMRLLSQADLLIRENCLICLEDFAVGDPVPDVPHPCLKNNNFVHKGCLEKWFKTTGVKGSFPCPVCRQHIGGCFDRKCATIVHIPRTQ